MPYHYSASRLLGAPVPKPKDPIKPLNGSSGPRQDGRDILLFFRGDVGKFRLTHYR